jgi:hypothetical protein
MAHEQYVHIRPLCMRVTSRNSFDRALDPAYAGEWALLRDLPGHPWHVAAEKIEADGSHLAVVFTAQGLLNAEARCQHPLGADDTVMPGGAA